MKKKILALMLALVVGCSIGAFATVSAAGETAESFVSVSAIDNSKAELTPVNVIHDKSSWAGAILINMGDGNRVAALDSHMSANSLDFLEYANARTVVSYTSADGTVDKLWSARLRENYIFVDIETTNHTHAVGDKLTIKAGLTWGNYQIKQDLVYVFQGENQPLVLSTESSPESIVYTDVTIKGLTLISDTTRWGGWQAIEVEFNGITEENFPEYADNLASMNIEYVSGGTNKSIADFIYYDAGTEKDVTFVARLGDRNTTGSPVNPYSMSVGDKITFKAGSYVAYGLKGYRLTADVTYEITDPSSATGYALYTGDSGSGGGSVTPPPAPTTYTVSFNTAGGNSIPAQTIAEGGLVSKPNDPIRNGYTFKGWLCEGVAYNFATPVNSNIVLVATWEQEASLPVTYKVQFNSDGGSRVSTKYVSEGEVVAKPNNPTRDGYTFVCWLYNDAEYDFSTPVTENITLKAKWKANSSAGGNANDGGSGDAAVTGRLSCGSALGVSALIPSVIAIVSAGVVVTIKRKQK